jgi:alkylation response protein AidB-like acyl-CoA dehydrogenase
MDSDKGYDRAVWMQMARQLGLQGLAIPETYGGYGFSWVELIIVLEEMGRALFCSPYFATVAMASSALLAAGDDEASARLLPGIAAGETTATVAFTEDNGRWDDGGIQLVGTPDGERWRLTGHKSFVVDGCTATLVLVAGRTGAGLSLFAVDGSAPGLRRQNLTTLDQTRKLARLEFDDTPAELIGVDGGAAGALARFRDLTAIALAAEQVGGAQRCLDMSVEYAKVRRQFGRQIGSFQAIKHMCAEVLLEVESARSAAYYAGWVAADDSDDLGEVASLAKAYCSSTYVRAAENNIQIHGGIGFTWEHDAHLYFRRAKSSELYLGDAAYHRELLARRLQI